MVGSRSVPLDHLYATVETTLELLVTNLAVHVEAQCDANDWDYATQHWVFCMDCYSVHISKEFLAWCTLNYPRMHLLYIPANFAGWLQPLDISFRILQAPASHVGWSVAGSVCHGADGAGARPNQG